MTVLDEHQEILGTTVRITVVSKEIPHTSAGKKWKEKASEAIRKAFSECQRIDEEYSRFRENNQLSLLNSQINTWQKITPELFSLLQKAQEISEKTSGVFDLGIKEMLEKWGYNKDYTFKPAKEKMPSSKTKHSFAYELDLHEKVKIFRPLELGGLGKGYALDRMVSILEEFPNICVDAGGDMYARGISGKAKKWKVLFEHPLDVTLAIGEVFVDDFYLAASNPLKRKWKNYHHLVDPYAKRPAKNMLAVYTQAKTGLLADAYSTSLFVLGFEKAKTVLPKLPVEAMIVSPQGEIYKTPDFREELFTRP